jgi:hypothetical protein
MFLKKINYTIVITIHFVLFAASVSAQSGIDVRAGIETGTWQPYKLAIGEFKLPEYLEDELDYQSSDSLRLMLCEVITNDLDFHVFFDTVSIKQFYLDVWEIDG